MKLFYAAASPFVRKVLVQAIETGVADKLENVTTITAPIKVDADLEKANPIKKIPALETEHGVLYDSRVICEYLDSLHDGPKMFPANGPARWTALRLQSLGDGIMDAGVLSRYEGFLRPEDKRWDDWLAAQTGKIVGGLDAANAEASSFGDRLDIGTIAVACAIGYLDFRFDDMGWRNGRTALAGWYETFSARSSMDQTKPPA